MPGSTYRILVALCLTLGITACGEPQQVEVTHIVEQTTIVIQTVVVDEVVRQDITATPKPMLEDTITPYTASNQSIIGHWYNPGTGEEIKFLANGLLVNGVSVARYAISADGTHCTRTRRLLVHQTMGELSLITSLLPQHPLKYTATS